MKAMPVENMTRYTDDVERERDGDVAAGQRRRDGIRRAQQAVYGPGLASDFGGHPTRNDRDEAERRGRLAQPEEPALAVTLARRGA